LGVHLINNPHWIVFVNLDNWYFKKWQIYGIKTLPKSWRILLENSDFWQCLPNLAASDNPVCAVQVTAVVTS